VNFLQSRSIELMSVCCMLGNREEQDICQCSVFGKAYLLLYQMFVCLWNFHIKGGPQIESVRA
jgi:hypothetical protein